MINDVRVGVIEPWQHGRATEPDQPRSRSVQRHQIAAATGDHPAAGHSKMAVRPETGRPERADAPAGEDQVRTHCSLD